MSVRISGEKVGRRPFLRSAKAILLLLLLLILSFPKRRNAEYKFQTTELNQTAVVKQGGTFPSIFIWCWLLVVTSTWTPLFLTPCIHLYLWHLLTWFPTLSNQFHIHRLIDHIRLNIIIMFHVKHVGGGNGGICRVIGFEQRICSTIFSLLDSCQPWYKLAFVRGNLFQTWPILLFYRCWVLVFWVILFLKLSVNLQEVIVSTTDDGVTIGILYNLFTEKSPIGTDHLFIWIFRHDDIFDATDGNIFNGTI